MRLLALWLSFCAEGRVEAGAFECNAFEFLLCFSLSFCRSDGTIKEMDAEEFGRGHRCVLKLCAGLLSFPCAGRSSTSMESEGTSGETRLTVKSKEIEGMKMDGQQDYKMTA